MMAVTMKRGRYGIAASVGIKAILINGCAAGSGARDDGRTTALRPAETEDRNCKGVV
ncbi:hypothetical protein HanIR_Chr09g0405631 [Helianthus annuus]|nr:hypothetical protein HanIR_Chr09g0405631 [Helianthus annuus]